jgi:hypothetical protein
VNSAVSSAGVEAREVEQVSGQLGEPRHLLAHRSEELLPGRGIELWFLEQLEEPAEREEGRPQLVGSVGDELTAGAVEPREPQAHPLEAARQLSHLVAARIDDRLLEVARGDPLGGLLEPA